MRGGEGFCCRALASGWRLHFGNFVERLEMKIDGGCHCGYITYSADADPERTSICHCTDCQTLSGTAFRLSIPAPDHAFRVLTEPPFIKTGESGRSECRRSVRAAVGHLRDVGRRRAGLQPSCGHRAPTRSARSGGRSGRARNSAGLPRSGQFRKSRNRAKAGASYTSLRRGCASAIFGALL
jgi:hypothetical protein